MPSKKPISAAKVNVRPKGRRHSKNTDAPSRRSSVRLRDILPRPVFSDEPHTDDESEYLRAVRRWRDETGNRFPTACDYRQILISLGYRKSIA